LNVNLPTIATLGLTTSAAVAAAGGLTYAALSAQSRLFGPTLIAGSDPGQLALTYDDGPNPAATPQLLEMLACANVRATFFLIGGYVRQHSALTREIHAAGHLIGNHTMTHPWLAWQSRARIRAEIADCNALLEDTLGVPVRFFRPPHGARRPYVLRLARELGLTTTQWNVMPKDWEPVDAATILLRIQRGIGRNRRWGRASNILLHDGNGSAPNANRLATVEASRRLLALCPAHSFVTPEAWVG
jgi:peptidoglycan/xylan/chitin deacetylase (PgdA/CDA1 family)